MQKYFLHVLGCAMNISDSERIDQILSDLGYSKTRKENEANVFIVVACSVKQSAINRVYGKIHNWNKLKKNQDITTILTGCVLETDKKSFLQKFDHVININEISKLPEILNKKKQNYNRDYFKITPQRTNNFQALVPIMTGCNNFCSYCAVPYVRGREKSRAKNEIIKECQELIKSGYKEITLVGQNVNSYQPEHLSKITATGKFDFVDLLEKIASISGDFWIKFVSPHPKDTSLILIKTIAKHKNICNYFHLPLQSGSDKILESMNRPYTQKKYLNLVKNIYKYIPNVQISTDVILGFPGETKKDFNETIKIFKQANFTMAFISKYSPRKETKAFELEDDVTYAEKKIREEEINIVLAKTALENNKKLLNQNIKVLITEKKNKDYFGITEHNKNVKIKSVKSLKIGSFQIVKITKIETWKISGEIK